VNGGCRPGVTRTVHQLVQYILDFDIYLAQLITVLGPWSYVSIAAVIFSETGLVVAPFLPGESLLLASGTLAGADVLNPVVLGPALFAAAFLGDIVNYLIGRWIGSHLLSRPNRYLKPAHIARAHEFYERHGGLAIVLARYLPIVRTLAPFVAGVARLEFHKMVVYAAIAAASWVAIFFGAGLLFGNVPWVQDYLALALVIAVCLSATPGVVVWGIHRLRRRQVAAE
jgi:membrane-associated protein